MLNIYAPFFTLSKSEKAVQKEKEKHKMKQIKRLSTVLLAILLVFACLLGTVGCYMVPTGSEETTAGSQNGGSNQKPGNNGSTDNTPDADGKVSYTVNVKTLGGMVLSGLKVFVYEYDESTGALGDLKNYGTTDKDGIARIKLAPNGKYRAVLEGLSEGYNADQNGYVLTDVNGTQITVSSSVIPNTGALPSGVTYKLGSVMHDFSITDSDGKTHVLSDLLKEKDMVLINMWYDGCTWCEKEFPYMEQTYCDERYADDIEIIAISTMDDMASIKTYKQNFTVGETTGLSFPMAPDTIGATSAFAVNAAPTSIVIDRYGVVCMIHPGAITTTRQFYAIYDHFVGENYQQVLIEDPSILTPTERPDVQMPSSSEMGAVFNQGVIDVTYAPETSGESAEYSWPFVIGSKDNLACIQPSNANKPASYATLYARVKLQKGQALAFDYLAACESGNDILYVLVDRESIYQISGESSGWATCYPYVALEDGEYELAFCYLKDESNDVSDDTVYLRNLRVVSEQSIDVPTYIPRACATSLASNNSGYQNYVTVVYNETDGYYHVGSVNGPLLLANLMGVTQFSNEVSVYALAYNGQIKVGGTDYYEQILPYCTIASNSMIDGVCTVNAELAELLKIVAQAVGGDTLNADQQWLQMCKYYDAYGTDGVPFENPILGLADFCAFEAVEYTDANPVRNTVTYRRLLMPRGYKYKFVPERSGAYRITSYSDMLVNGWIFGEGNQLLYAYEVNERNWADYAPNDFNVTMVYYMEAGKSYYIDIAYWDVYATGSFEFDIKYMGADYKTFSSASPGVFTFEENNVTGSIGETIAGGIDVILGEDGYYHELRADGTQGSILYADFSGVTAVFNVSLEKIIEMGGFNFTMNADDLEVVEYLEYFGADKCEASLREAWGNEGFEAWAEEVKFYEVKQGIYHGTVDRTEEIKTYLSKKEPASTEAPLLEGCVKVDAKLAELLQQLMDKYTFEGVENSWRKLCYYWKSYTPATTGATA